MGPDISPINPENRAIIIDALDKIDDEKTWAALVDAMLKKLCGCLDEPLLDIVFNRASKKIGPEAGHGELLAAVKEILYVLEVYLTVDRDE